MTEFEKIAKSWKVAAADLGFAFISPIELEDEGRKIRYVGLIRDFGSAKGMLIFTSKNLETEPWASVARKCGFGYSCLGGANDIYRRETFIDTLDDWGWSPKDRIPPTWYTGKPWTT